MIKKIFISFILFTLSFPLFAEGRSDIHSIFQKLLYEHQKQMQSFFHDTNLADPFEKAFFSDFTFTRNMQTVSFFENLKNRLDRGETPGHAGIMQISYSSYSNINGKQNAVSYEYRSDGKHIVLTRGTWKDGKLLKTVYNYSPTSKELETREFKGKELLQKKTYKYEI
ncbi:MAG: hypothetical protein H7A25_03665 [Leptospiraceae bacterium]|nr:hypothetical protein [Leptospiraceae bacterium]MCP5498973.1 hypothetical protein [Leptospiraceae bacterium]